MSPPLGRPLLLLTSRTSDHVFDDYLHEALLVEGYHAHDWRSGDVADVDLAPYALVIIAPGAAAQLDAARVADYLAGGGRVVAFQPPEDWAPLFGLQRLQGNYNIAREAFVQVETTHPWLADFPWADLQVPGENPVYVNQGAEPLAWTAGQLGQRSVYASAVVTADHRAVMFTYDLPEVLVRLQQGRPELDNTGPDPDSNRDGKFTAEEAFAGQRRFELRHVPQADVHRDLLGRVLRGLLADTPLPRVWHFPAAAQGLLFLDGDGDSMVWEDLELVVRTVEEFGAKFTFYLMDQQIGAFAPEAVAAVFARGHDFGPHPWTGYQPTPEAWAEEVAAITARLRDKFGLAPVAQRCHCIIFPAWDHSARALAGLGLGLDVNFCNGYCYQSGYLNGSALLTRFVDREGQLLDCWEQSTATMEDGAGSPKILLPQLTQEQALALSRELMTDLARKYHGVYHPYFHPISLAGRGSVECYEWFRGVLELARELGMPSLSARAWLAFHRARQDAGVDEVHWDGRELAFSLQSASDLAGLTVLLPQTAGAGPAAATVNGQPVALEERELDGARWGVLIVDLRGGEPLAVRVRYDSN